MGEISMVKESEKERRRGKDEGAHHHHHAVCLPMPAQGHLNPMMVLATFLHSHGYVITFVHTDFDRSRILHSGGSDALRDTETFRYVSFPDGLPPDSDVTGNRHIPSLCESLHTRGFEPFLELLRRIDDEGPRVSLVIWDGITSFGRRAAEELGIPNVMVWTASATGLLSYLHLPQFVSRGIFPFKDEACLSNKYLKNIKVDWIPGMEGITLKDVPGIIRSTDPNDIMFNFVKEEVKNAHKASSIFINTFEDLEFEALSSMASILPCPIYPIGPLSLLHDYQPPSPPNLWKDDNNNNCMQWLKQREANSVVYVNFGSVINLTLETFKEFAWGLVESKQYVLWVIRKDLIAGGVAEWPEELKEVAGEKCFVAEWCPQREVLLSESVGVFVTHCGWNSVLEGIGGGVAMVCWPAFAEQMTNSYYVCEKWGVGVEIGEEVKREEVRKVVVEMMEGEKGKEMRKRAAQLKDKACEAVLDDAGSSWLNLNKLLLL